MNCNIVELSRETNDNFTILKTRIVIGTNKFDIDFIVNIEDKQIRLTDLLNEFNKAFKVNKTLTNFFQLQNVVKFIDWLSYNKYGHLHYTYNNGESNLYDIEEYIPEQMETYKINNQFLAGSKFCSNKDILDKNDEIIHETSSKGHKGKITDYKLVEKLIEYVVPKYKFIKEVVMKYLDQVMNNEEITINEQTMDETIDNNNELKMKLKSKILAIEKELEELRKLVDEL